MDSIISNILTAAPTGLWEKIIMGLEGAVGSFALSIIILTVIIKLIMSPIDYLNRRTSKKMTAMQKKLQPQIDAISKKYASDDKIKNQKLGELYKKEKMNPIGSCLIMLLNFGLTLAIFITLLSGMNTMASYKITTQYENLEIAYVQEYVSTTYGFDINDRIEENNNKPKEEQQSLYDICKPYILEIKANENAVSIANNSVKNEYKELKESFLWIDNIWLADSPFKKSIPSFSEYANVAKLSKETKANVEVQQVYAQIMDPLKESNERVNGYFILLVICAGTSFLNQWLMTKRNKKDGAAQSSGLVIIMPMLMAIFTLFYTTMFSLYMITSQIISIALTPLINLISDKVDKVKEEKNQPKDRLKRI